MLKKAKMIGTVWVIAGLMCSAVPAVAGSQPPIDDADRRFVSEDIYFKYRSYAISPEASEILERKAAWLREHPEAVVIIEGHTDSSAGREENLAFGEKRAGSVKSYLMNFGIDGARLIAVSYGEEALIDPGKDKAARARNRRVHFVIQRMD